MAKEFKLPYYCSNNGDGSCSVRFTPTEKEAEEKDSNQSEGWGEPSSDIIRLKVEKNKLFFQDFQRVDGKYQYVWVEVTEPA